MTIPSHFIYSSSADPSKKIDSVKDRMDGLRLLIPLLGCALMVIAQIPNFGGCPDKNVPMPNFDLSRFLGEWYEIWRVPNLAEAGASCVKNNYIQTADGKIHVENEIVPLAQPKMVIQGELRNAGKAGEGKITIKYKLPVIPTWEVTYHILDTDYDSYAVLWSCSNYGIVHTQSAWLMARNRKPPGPILQRAYGVLDAFDLSRRYFVNTTQDDCDIAAEAPDVVPLNPIPATATRIPTDSEIKIPAEVMTPPEASDNTKKTTDIENPTQAKTPLENAESPPSTVEDVPKAPSEIIQDKPSPESIGTPEKINIPSDTIAETSVKVKV